MRPAVVLCNFVEDAEIGFIKLNDGCGIEQSAVEVPDGVLAENALALAHGLEEKGRLAQEAFGVEAVFAEDRAAEDVAG